VHGKTGPDAATPETGRAAACPAPAPALPLARPQQQQHRLYGTLSLAQARSIQNARTAPAVLGLYGLYGLYGVAGAAPLGGATEKGRTGEGPGEGARPSCPRPEGGGEEGAILGGLGVGLTGASLGAREGAWGVRPQHPGGVRGWRHTLHWWSSGR